MIYSVICIVLAGVYFEQSVDAADVTTNITCSTFDFYLEHFYVFSPLKYEESVGIYSLTSHPIVQFFLFKILDENEEESGINDLEKAFSDNVKQKIQIEYITHFICGGNKKKTINTDYTFNEENQLAGILKTIETRKKKITITIDVTPDDGFEECHEVAVCQGKTEATFLNAKKNLEHIFCQVTELVRKATRHSLIQK